MELRDYFRLFSEDEIVRGAELYYAGDLENFSITEEKRKKTGKTTERESEKRPGQAVKISAQWKEHSYKSNGREEIASRNCSILLDEDLALPLSCDCACDEFRQDLYGCQHTASLLTAYMVQKKGEDVFVSSRLEERLRDLSNAEDPFAPGVMKRTDGRLRMLLDEAVDAPLPVWIDREDSAKRGVPLEVECSVSVIDKEHIWLDLKAGFGKKYVVKKIAEFLDAYRQEKPYAFGKEEAVLRPGMCGSFSRALLDYLVSLVNAREKGMISNKLFVDKDARSDRYMRFSGRELDGLMELLDGQNIILNETEGYGIELDKKGIRGILKKKAYGASLQVKDVTHLFTTGSWMYLHDGEAVFRIAVSSSREIRELETIFGWTEPLYIRESDIGKVLQRLRPLFDDYGELITRGIDTEAYAKEKPAFEFRLDYTEESLLTCEPFAVYPQQDLRCHLFDSEADKNRRNGSEEAAAAELLTGIFDTMDRKSFLLHSVLGEDELFSFMVNNLPRLEEMGTVYSTDSLKRRGVRYLPKVQAGIKVDNGSLLFSIKGDGISDKEMAEILTAYRRKKRYYRLKSGEFLSLEGQEDKSWTAMAELYENYGKKDPAKMRIPLYRALYLQEALEERASVAFDPSEEYLELLRRMDPESVKKLPAPKSLQAIIRPYQVEGFRWIKLLKRCGFGGILADDMGLGKTLQVLSFLLSEKAEKKEGDELRTLVVCPASLVYNWKREIGTYTPELSVAVITGTVEERTERIRTSMDRDIWITSYDLLKRDIALYETVRFANEVIDEAQYIKNQSTQASRSVRLVDSKFRIALTGTPIENHLSELWSIMDYLMPGFLYDHTGFQKNYEIPIVASKDTDILERLRSMVHPFILRRMKRQVLKELPEKLEETIFVTMDPEQKKLYQANAKKLKEELDGMSQSEFKSGKMQVLAQLTMLRELCCDPSLLYEDYKGGSAKLEACLELVRQSIQSGHKLLLFSQFTSMLDIICGRLKQEGIAYHRIDGGVNKEKRMQMVDSFANDDVPVFCISLKAGGTGLNLTAADIVIHYDPWWNQAAQNQATDRTHRIGQTRTVNVYELIAEDSIEERIQKIKESKMNLAEDILSGGEISSASFDKEEMIRLLS